MICKEYMGMINPKSTEIISPEGLVSSREVGRGAGLGNDNWKHYCPGQETVITVWWEMLGKTTEGAVRPPRATEGNMQLTEAESTV